MNLKTWYKRRGANFIIQRGMNLLKRYRLGSDKAVRRIQDCLKGLADLGCLPTFFTPAFLLQRNPAFIRLLQEAGAEIAVHGYHHINLGDLSASDASCQLLRAVRSFERYGIEARGFRYPYLGYKDEFLAALPDGLFDYSSNQTIYWGVDKEEYGHQHKNILFNTLDVFYNAKDSSQKLCLPWMRSNMVEIPVCVPDDIQLYDGLRLDSSGIANAWAQILQQTYLRGEIFTLIFHTELADCCDSPFGELIRRARQYRPGVWIARLREISDWWREKANFKVEITPVATGLRLHFTCTPHATILARGLDSIGAMPVWYKAYHRLQSNVLEVSTNSRPFVGLGPNAPERTVSFLREQGYILDTGETARSCGIYLDNAVLMKQADEVELTNFIESSPAPLVRFWPWPDGAKSALSFTGDLDALSLMDYASRLFV